LAAGLDPTPTTFAIDILDEGDKLATNWTVSTPRYGATFAVVSEDPLEGNPAPSYSSAYDEMHNEGEQAYAYRNFGIAESAVIKAVADVRFSGDPTIQQAILIVGAEVTGVKGALVGFLNNTLYVSSSIGWSPGAAPMTTIATPAAVPGDWYKISADVVVNPDNSVTVTAKWLDDLGVELATVTATANLTIGDYVGFTNGSTFDASIPFTTYYDNLHVQASGSTNYTPVNVATSYVYTFVNDLGQESAPSPASSTILRPDGVSITVTTPTTTPVGTDPDYGIDTKRIYRAVVGNTGTVFQLVAETPLAQADYVDVLTDSQLGEVLQSDLWALPPDDLRGILALPNGVMAGFSKNQLCLSAQNYPHAWPVEYRLTVDTDIVAIGNIDTAVVIGTKNFVYLAIGSDPAAYSMTKLEVPQACVAKRSLSYLTGIGVVFASPDGLMAVSGNGSIRNLTSSLFTRQQWQALAPETIRAVAHEDIYWMFTGEGSWALDMKSDGFGLVEVAFHATAMHADPLTDTLYLVLDSDDEPEDDLLPLPSTAPTPNGQVIYAFDSPAGSGHMVYRHRGRLNLLPRPAAFTYCRVKAEEFTNVVLRLYGDGVVLLEMAVANDDAFTLPMSNAYNRFELEVIGTSRVYSVEVAEDVGELQ
jgi:hypothetical protein